MTKFRFLWVAIGTVLLSVNHVRPDVLPLHYLAYPVIAVGMIDTIIRKRRAKTWQSRDLA